MTRLMCAVMLTITGVLAISGCANIIPQQYEGDYVDRPKDGHGTYVWANGDRYEGDFVNGTLQGRGIGVWGNGTYYDGDWFNGRQHGHGTMVWPGGDRYEGGWANGKAHGHGTMAWQSGARYDGAWVNGNRTGRGTFVTANGDRFEGDFIDGNVNTSDGIYKSWYDLGAGRLSYHPLGWIPYELLAKKKQGNDYPINELPMYGQKEFTAEQTLANQKLIEDATRDGRSREDAANSLARVGWNFYYEGNKSTAIKRFNQAWLLDPRNQLAFWGFAAISVDRNEVDDALKYFQMAIDTGLENAKLQRDYERALKMIAQ